MSTGDDFGHRWGRNGEFCVAVGHVIMTAGILANCTLAQIPRRLKSSHGMSCLLRTSPSVCKFLKQAVGWFGDPTCISHYQGRTGSLNRPWLIRQTGPMSSGVTRNSGTSANHLSKENPPSLAKGPLRSTPSCSIWDGGLPGRWTNRPTWRQLSLPWPRHVKTPVGVATCPSYPPFSAILKPRFPFKLWVCCAVLKGSLLVDFFSRCLGLISNREESSPFWRTQRFTGWPWTSPVVGWTGVIWPL